MGASVSARLTEEVSRKNLENSPTAPGVRKIFRSWNSADLWSALRRYWNEFPKKEEWLTYADVAHVLCSLNDAEVMFLWDAFANSGTERMSKYAMFVAIAMYSGSSVQEKGRFILTVFDTGMRGLVSINEFSNMVFVVLETLGMAGQQSVKKKDVVRELEAEFFAVLMSGEDEQAKYVEDVELASAFASVIKTIDNTRQTLKEGTVLQEDKILGLVEMQEVCKYVTHIVDSAKNSFVCPHHSAIENVKRVSPSMVMARGPSRNLGGELDAKNKKKKGESDANSDTEVAAWKAGAGGEDDGVGHLLLRDQSGITAWTPKKHEEKKGDLSDEEKAEKAREVGEQFAASNASGEGSSRSTFDDFVHITLKWSGAVTDSPALRSKVQREIAKCLALAETRVLVTFIGMGVMHVSIRSDATRSAPQLGFLFKTQTEAQNGKGSSLKQGLLKDVELYSGLGVIESYGGGH